MAVLAFALKLSVLACVPFGAAAYECPAGHQAEHPAVLGRLRASAPPVVLGSPAAGECSVEGAVLRWNGTVRVFEGCAPRCCNCWPSPLAGTPPGVVDALPNVTGVQGGGDLRPLGAAAGVLSPQAEGLFELFGKVGETPDSPGGLLVTMLDSASIMNSSAMDMHQVALWGGSCAVHHGFTCLAFSYLRRDLPPIVYNYPSLDQWRVGLILDPSILSELITGMFVFDGNTNERQSCANEVGEAIDFSDKWTPAEDGGEGGPFACMRAAAKSAGVPEGAKVYQMPADAGQKFANGVCDPRVQTCAFLNSGGCMATEDIGNWPGCADPSSPEFDDFKSCFEFHRVDSTTYRVAFARACRPCSQRYVCHAEDPPAGRPDRVYDAEASEFKAYVGADGRRFPELFLRNGTATREWTNNAQCKWAPQSWSTWVEASRGAYRTALAQALSPAGRSGSAWADPAARGAYFSNEVDVYTNPDIASEAFQRQNDLFMGAIVGVAVDTQTCAEKLRFLDGAKSSGLGGKVFTGADDRCAAFREGAPQSEKSEIRKAEEAARHLARLIGPGTPVLGARFSSNAAPEPRSWRRALAGAGHAADFLHEL